MGLAWHRLIALSLAATFRQLFGAETWGFCAAAVVSVTAEVALMAPACAWLSGLCRIWALAGPSAGWFGRDLGAEPVAARHRADHGRAADAVFSYAARRVSMATLGLVQFLNPTLQFLTAVLVFAEPFSRWHCVAFGLIWAALALYSAAAGVRTGRRAGLRSARARPGLR